MSIAIMIGTHGVAAEQLLRTTEMLIGEQDNVSFIDFIPGENADTLFDKYTQKLTDLDTSKGVLFLVDTWGGSPFNAASRIVNEHDNYDIITGVNVPMLVETFMCRDDNPSMNELITVALETGRGGVRSFKFKEVEAEAEPAPVVSSTPAPALVKAGPGEHMVIALARIDDRLIHGQVATRWTKETQVKRIIVVSDDVAKDQVRSTLLKQVAPPGVTAHVVDVAKCIRVYNNPKYAGERVMLLFTNPTDVKRIVEEGVDVKSVNIGGMAYHDGKTMVTNAVSINQEDIDAFNYLNDKKIELEVRKVSSDSKVYMMDLINKLKK
ncbi:PTS mannose transporter subunit IIAB [Providencia hangzhouensis]|uniref:PTS system mannose-specific EIIAB component n=1 Tax=Providencia rettgeri TaxID=587 RepID=A0AAJ4NMC8_PRORE|nr:MULTISPECIES: PTS mannose transporter subunit IIAB [Providencia]MCG9527106.1 PTS mannose transporter subunit IIAB [Providencia rettgeri]MDB9568392.1 PTS mannose transporter subunit IIAB [Providencia rettgeri]MDI9091533.1 PTS mannose transporter subunit IIAB [Providencia rettgeri]MDT2037446.1 PTS mannose transporter subunit IIAB [Providencia rettgeri]QWQ18596.1 PTS mannose transporter subunit IIAB [Providencia rettgeri]